MKRPLLFLALLTAAAAAQTPVAVQVKRTETPLGSLLTEALANSSLTTSDSKPFHIRIDVSEPANPQSQYQGTIEEWWASPQDWRREVTSKSGVRQTIVYTSGTKSEEDTGDYLPNWLGRFVTAAFDPVPNAGSWDTKNVMITHFILPNGMKRNGCGRRSVVIGSGDAAVVQFESICFTSSGQLDSADGPEGIMMFQDFRSFDKRSFPGGFLGYRGDGVKLSGRVTKLERLPKSNSFDLFKPLARNDSFFDSVKVDSKQLQVLCAGVAHLGWPPVHSGEVQGHVFLYLYTDKTGRVREVYAVQGDNAEITGFAREQAAKWTLQTVTDPVGRPVQMEGALSLPFETTLDDTPPK